MTINIKDILEKIPSAKFIGDEKATINKLIQLDSHNNNPHALFWCNDKNIDQLKHITNGTVICSEKIQEIGLNKNCNYIIVAEPKRAFQQIMQHFFYNNTRIAFISPSSNINATVKFGKNVFIGHNVVIEENCVIGNDTSIGHNTVIMRDTQIGNNCVIGSNNTIGGIGFGYVKNENGQYEVVPHIGNVVINNHVEIGNNTCIDRAVIGSTILHENVKVDNQVHIAHGVIVGENTLIIANSIIGGSAIIGKNVWIAPNACIINKGVVKDNAIVGMGAVVIKPVEENTTVIGNPAKKLVK